MIATVFMYSIKHMNPCTCACCHVVVTIIENESKILSVWAKHFEELETSKVDLSSQLKDNVAIMFANSFDREDYVLDVRNCI